MKKPLIITVLGAFVLVAASVIAASAADYDSIITKWTRQETYKDDYQAELRLKITYYADEYIEALIQKEAEENLWTQDEVENYKYRLLSSLNLQEYIPFHIEFDNRGPSMHMAPFDEQIKLWIGKKSYKPVDYEKRFNFELSGKRDGMVFFPRYDEDGEPLLEGVNTIRLRINGGISSQTIGKTVEFFWDTAKDTPSDFIEGAAMRRLEADRLIKRLQRLNEEKAKLEEELADLDAEIQKVQERLDELQ